MLMAQSEGEHVVWPDFKDEGFNLGESHGRAIQLGV